MTQLKLNATHYHQQMIEKRPEWAKRHGKVTQTCPVSYIKLVKDTLKSLGWDILLHSHYFPDLAPSITSSHQWDTCLQSSTSAISKKLENGSTNGLPQTKNSFSGKVFITYLKDELYRSRWPIF
jgi:hypothetical protein